VFLPFLSHRYTLVQRSGAWKRGFCLSLLQGLEGGSPTMLSTAQNPGGRLLRTLRTKAADGGTTPRLEEVLRFVSTALHSPSNRRKLRAGRFSEGIFEGISEDVYLWGSTVLVGRTDHAAAEKRRLQISQDDSRNLINITTQFAHRQPKRRASYKQPQS
jgi:hypothetical protein